MKPPQQSIAASTLPLLQANSSVCRPPEQKPITPTLAVAPGLLVGQPEHDRAHVVHVVGVLRTAAAPVERRRDRVVADIGEAPGEVADVIVEPEGLLDHDDAGVVAGLVGIREIGRDVAAAAGQ